MPGRLNEDFENTLGVPLLDGYGITETSTMVTMSWPSGTRRPGSCGLSLPGEAIRIVDTDSEIDVATGAEGELWVRGPNLMLGYHGRPEATAKALHGGWYHTGDLARADDDGFLTITGRIKELIIRGGENIYPAEVEAALDDCEQVADCAVTGIAHSSLGEVPVVFVVLREGQAFDESAIRSHVEARLSGFKAPERAFQIDDIPRTGSGKVKRHVLRELAERTP